MVWSEMTAVVRLKIVLRSHGLQPAPPDLEAIASHCATLFGFTDVACSPKNGEFRLTAEAPEVCNFSKVVRGISELFPDRPLVHVGIVSVTPVMRRVSNGHGRVQPNHEA